MNEYMKKHRKHLIKEAVIKSLMAGLSIGFLVLFIVAFVFFMTGFSAYWLSFVIFFVVSAAAVVALYFLKYRPGEKDIARRIDKLGLDERIITMTEYSDNDDYIFTRQREDAVGSLYKTFSHSSDGSKKRSGADNLGSSLIKIVIPVSFIIVLSVMFLLSSGMATVSVMSAEGVIPNGGKIIENVNEERNKRYFEVTYLVEGGGFIEGDEVQIVEAGKDAAPIVAVADDGWVFMYWSDELEDPFRTDVKIKDNIVLTAYFQEAEDGDDGDEGEGEGDQPGDEPSDSEGENQGDNDSNNPSSGAGGKYDPANQVFDGETYYGGDIYKQYYDDGVESVSQEGTTDKDEKDYIIDYLKTIAD